MPPSRMLTKFLRLPLYLQLRLAAPAVTFAGLIVLVLSAIFVERGATVYALIAAASTVTVTFQTIALRELRRWKVLHRS